MLICFRLLLQWSSHTAQAHGDPCRITGVMIARRAQPRVSSQIDSPQCSLRAPSDRCRISWVQSNEDSVALRPAILSAMHSLALTGFIVPYLPPHSTFRCAAPAEIPESPDRPQHQVRLAIAGAVSQTSMLEQTSVTHKLRPRMV